MAAHELDTKAEQIEARQTSNLSSLSADLLQGGSLRQLSQFESAKTMANNGFPQLELVDGNTALMRADSNLRLASKYETGAELTSDRELKQAGLNPKDVKHTVKQDADGWTNEKTTVKYPSGIEVTVEGKTKQMESGNTAWLEPSATIKEPLPKGFHKDKDGSIMNSHNEKVAQINDDGTVTIKVGKQYLTQGPAGVTEATVFEHKNGQGLVGRLKVND